MSVQLPFRSRGDAGRLLGVKLAEELQPPAGSLVLGLVRGGAIVAKELAEAAGLAWDILIVRKIGAPLQPEYAVGAYAETGSVLFNKKALHVLGLGSQWQQQAAAQAEAQCIRLQQDLRAGLGAPAITARHVILTDDGIATGMTMFAALEALQTQAASVTIAVPVLAPDAKFELQKLNVPLIYLACPAGFQAVGQYYLDFAPIPSEKVRQLLAARIA